MKKGLTWSQTTDVFSRPTQPIPVAEDSLWEDKNDES